jgi:hypothetical protein
VKRWKFEDPENLAVIVNQKVFDRDGWIAYVSHDADDESWQFHVSESEFDENDLIVVGLGEIIEHDESVAELADLPLGWHAWRDTKSSPWRRGKIT